MDIRVSVGERFWRIMALSSFLSLSTSLCESVSCGVSNTQDSWRTRKKEQGADDFSLRSISGCIVRRAAFLLFLSILAAAYLSSTDNWTSQVINEPLALKGLMRARAPRKPLFKQPSRATPTFRLRNYGYWVCANCCQLSCRRAAASARRERKSDAPPVCAHGYLESIYMWREMVLVLLWCISWCTQSTLKCTAPSLNNQVLDEHIILCEYKIIISH